METRIFINRKGDKIILLEEEISYDLGKTWEKTGNTKYDEDNIEYDSCDCSEQYRWDLQEGVELLVDCAYYTSHILMVKYGCEDWKPYEGNIIRVGDFIRDGSEDCAFDAPHKKELNGNTWVDEEGNLHQGYDEWVWVDDKWIKINCDDENASDEIIDKVGEEWILVENDFECDEETFSKYAKYEKYIIYSNGYKHGTGEFKRGEVIEEKSLECGFGKSNPPEECDNDIINVETTNGNDIIFAWNGKYNPSCAGFYYTLQNNTDHQVAITCWLQSQYSFAWGSDGSKIVTSTLKKINKFPSVHGLCNFAYMFAGCEYLEDFDYTMLNTYQISNLGHMFYNCKTLTHIDLSHFNTVTCLNYARMFYNCDNLETLNISNWFFYRVADNTDNKMEYFIRYCPKLKTLIMDNVKSFMPYDASLGYAKTVETLSVKNFQYGVFKYMNTFFYNIGSADSMKTVYAEGCSEEFIDFLKNKYPNANIIL